MKKVILLIYLFLLCSCKLNKNISLSINEFEYGEEVYINEISNLKCNNKINTLKLGNNKEIINCNNKKYEINYEVKDKTKPIIWMSNIVTRNVGYENNIAREITCMDNADRNPNCYIVGDYDVNTIGTYNLTFVAIDYSGNKSSKDFKLVIKEKTQKVVSNNYTNELTNYLPFEDVYSKRKNENTLIGIDVSKYQGNIDFQKVKNAGVEFVIIRLGYRYYYDEPLTLDPYFLQNIKGATQAGIKIGIYFYSYAKSKEDAIEEANFVLDNIKGYNIEMPIAFDWESFNYFNASEMNLYDLTEVSNTFLDTIKKAGYIPVHYASKSYLEYIWGPIKHDIWLAHYTNETTYKGDYIMWQLASNGKVDGINNYVDIDIYYKN